MKKDWAWMREHMPDVVRLLTQEREGGNGALLAECWRRGVVQQEPGWFYASQGGVSLGVPSVEFVKDVNQALLATMFPNRAVLMLRGQMVPPAGSAPIHDHPQAPSRHKAALAFEERLHGAN